MKKYIFVIAILALVFQGFKVLSPDSKMIVIKKETSNSIAIQQVDKGKVIYTKACVACHQMNGNGIPSVFPPVAKSDYLNADVNRSIKQMIKGSLGPIIVNGKKYNTPMPAQALNDQQIADVLTYVYNSWGNNKSIVTPEMVAMQRKKLK
jgi:nitrite reductase (NO-forming)